MTDLTAANAVIMLTAAPVFSTPFQLQEFAADDIFNSGTIKAGDGSMGVDGKYSFGFAYEEVPQEYNLQGDSASIAFFDGVYAYEQANLTKIVINGLTILTGLATQWVMTRGFLSTYTPIASAGKIIKPRKYEIRWNKVAPQPV